MAHIVNAAIIDVMHSVVTVDTVMQSTGEGRDHNAQGHLITLEILSVNVNDSGRYECLVKPFDGVAVAATVNFAVIGKLHFT